MGHRFRDKLFHNYKKFVIICALVLPLSAFSHLGEDLAKHAGKDAGIIEITGNNDHPRIDFMQALVGIGPRDPYCAAAVYTWHYEKMIFDVPRSGWSPDWFRHNLVKFDDIDAGDCVGFYFGSKGRIAHIGLVAQKPKSSSAYIKTIEGNTSGAGSDAMSEKQRNGDGIFFKLRNKKLLSQKNNKFSRYWK